MKHTFYLVILLSLLGAGCRKALQYHDVLYFTGTEQVATSKFTVDGPGSIGLSVTSSTKVAHDITVGIKIDSNLVSVYNKSNGTKYAFLPDGSYTLDAENVIIKDGTNVSGSAKFSITTLDNFKEGVTYLVPVTIDKVDGGMDVLEPSRTIYLIVNRTIITQAAAMSPNYFTVPSFQTDGNLSSLPAVTLECRVYVNSFQTKNPFISSVMGIEENFLLRFGDVSVANNQLQLAGGLINTKKYPVTSKTFFSVGQWYHVAAVYDGATISLYVNGVMDNYTDAESGGINLTDSYLGGFHVGYSSDGRLLSGAVSEARVWNRALTAAELQNNLCFVDPTTPGLVAYWRFNETDSDGNVTDLTGHGYKAAAAKPLIWVPGVRCPN
ncbi:MAG TPA: DUF1735 and LamG domain-containing protein [Puia sp.]